MPNLLARLAANFDPGLKLSFLRDYLTRDDIRHQSLREVIFHFGCRIYRAFQPHFLAEFLDDGMNSGVMSDPMRQAAQEAVTQAAFQIQQQTLAGFTPSRLDRLIHTLQALSDTGQRLGSKP